MREIDKYTDPESKEKKKLNGQFAFKAKIFYTNGTNRETVVPTTAGTLSMRVNE